MDDRIARGQSSRRHRDLSDTLQQKQGSILLGVPAASSAPLKVLDFIVPRSLVASGGGSLVTSGVFKIKSRLGSPAKVLEPKCHVYDIEVKHAGSVSTCVCEHVIFQVGSRTKVPPR